MDAMGKRIDRTPRKHELEPIETASEDELRAFCEGRLARFKIPKRVVLAAELPYSPYGKVMKAELKKTYLV